MAGRILVGTSSWADPGFIRDWYPPDLPAAERLPYYAAQFNLVEVNSTFYSIPARNLIERWCDQTPPGFVFDFKLHRLLSRHSTELKLLPPALRSLARVEEGKVQLTPALEQAIVREFLQATAPMAECGKLGAYLLQLTPAFGPKDHTLEELESLLALFSRFRLAVELRNRYWVIGDRLDETMAFFRKRHVTFVAVDGPSGEHFTTMPQLDVVTSPKLAYLRLHGRNLQGYLTGKTVAERFNYLYSDPELQSIAERAAKLAAQASETHVLYNNNASDYAPRNAAAFQKILARGYPETVSSAIRSAGQQPKPGRGTTLEFDFDPGG